MSAERANPWSTGRLEPLMRAVRERFPEARFAYRESPDGLRGYLDVCTTCEDDFEVLAVAAPEAIQLLLRDGMQVHVFPFRELPDSI